MDVVAIARVIGEIDQQRQRLGGRVRLRRPQRRPVSSASRLKVSRQRVRSLGVTRRSPYMVSAGPGQSGELGDLG
jgi:hypothetical protein